MNTVSVAVLRSLLERRSGLDLGRGGMETSLVNFVQRRLAVTGIDFARYLEQLELPGSEELRLLVEAMTVVYTWFFRDPGQFQVIEQLIADFSADRAMAIWVAGCATGEEPYSVAFVAAGIGKRVDILGTDLNTQALRHAEEGRYAPASLRAVDATLRSRYLGDDEGEFIVPETIRRSVRFQLGNLVESAPRAPTSAGWDLVICRNVLIYFSAEQARRALDTLANSLSPGSHLVLGASEAILERPTTLTVVGVKGRAVLERPPNGVSACAAHPLNISDSPQTSAKSSDVFRLPAAAPILSGATRAIESASGKWPCVSVESSPRSVLQPQTSAEVTVATRAQLSLQMGCDALERGDILAAQQCCAHAVQLEPTCAEAAMFSGIAQYLGGDLVAALNLLRGALCLDPTLWVACFYQALCFENMGFAEDAARCYTLVMKLAGDPAQEPNQHPFLRGWRNDLLAVASKRAHQGREGRDSGRLKVRHSVPR